MGKRKMLTEYDLQEVRQMANRLEAIADKISDIGEYHPQAVHLDGARIKLQRLLSESKTLTPAARTA